LNLILQIFIDGADFQFDELDEIIPDHFFLQRHSPILIILICHFLEPVDEGNHFLLIFIHFSPVDFTLRLFEGGQMLQNIVKLKEIFPVQHFLYLLEVDCDC